MTEAISHGQPAVLLVEDNRTDAALALHAVRAAGVLATVHVVSNGAAALEFLRLQPAASDEDVRLVLLDIKLPKIGGIDVLGRIKADPAMSRIPVVMFTSSAEPSDIQASYRLGANSYVVKPVDYAEFAETIVRTVNYWLEVNLTAERQEPAAPPRE